MKIMNVIVVYDRTRQQILMCLRRKDPYKGKLNFVGGKLETGESSEEAAYRELQEETGVKHGKLVSRDIFSLETLIVNGHIKRGQYVPSHLHLNVTYLAEADESEQLTVKADENQAVKWLTFDEAIRASTEPWMVEHIYKKLIDKCRN